MATPEQQQAKRSPKAPLIERGRPRGATAVVLGPSVYAALSALARERLPGEVAGALTGFRRTVAGGGRVIVVVDAVAVDLVSVGPRLTPDIEQWQTLGAELARRGDGARPVVVGWFYADPGIGLFPPRVSVMDVQSEPGWAADLFLLVSPVAGEAAFFTWDGAQLVPTGGYYEIDAEGEGALIAAWSGSLPEAGRWLGATPVAEEGGEPVIEQATIEKIVARLPKEALAAREESRVEPETGGREAPPALPEPEARKRASEAIAHEAPLPERNGGNGEAPRDEGEWSSLWDGGQGGNAAQITSLLPLVPAPAREERHEEARADGSSGEEEERSAAERAEAESPVAEPESAGEVAQEPLHETASLADYHRSLPSEGTVHSATADGAESSTEAPFAAPRAMPAPGAEPEVPSWLSLSRGLVQSPRPDADAALEADLADLFDAGLSAFSNDDLPRARELLAMVVHMRPDYVRRNLTALYLLAGIERQLEPVVVKRRRLSAAASVGLVVFIVVMLLVLTLLLTQTIGA